LIAKSFVPPVAIGELRDPTRYRRKLSQAGASERNRLLKLLEMANIKLSGVASDVFAVSGRHMLRALIAGEASHKILIALYRMLASGTNYQDLGAPYLDQRHHHRAALSLLRRRREIGYEVTLQAKAA
jgi:transposase